jgi:hypothetical protein
MEAAGFIGPARHVVSFNFDLYTNIFLSSGHLTESETCNVIESDIHL